MTLDETYNDLVESAKIGWEVRPRGLLTYEIPGPIMLKTEMNQTVLRYKMNTRLAIAEALMLVGGFFSLDVIREVAPNANLDLYRAQSDYGPRIGYQMHDIIRLLTNDPRTRRAVVYLNCDRHFGSSDLACTTSIQWLFRNDHLNAHVTMRSWDLAFGFPMDLMMYGLVTQALASALGTDYGNLYVSASCVHVYESTVHLAHADSTLDYTLGPAWVQAPPGWTHVRQCATHALTSLLTNKGDFSDYIIMTHAKREEVE